MPTYSLLITIATLALPTTISKLVAERKKRSAKILSNAVILIMTINIIVVIIMLLAAKFIASSLLHEPDSYLILISAILTFPIISISSIIKGYYYGKQNMNQLNSGMMNGETNKEMKNKEMTGQNKSPKK